MFSLIFHYSFNISSWAYMLSVNLELMEFPLVLLMNNENDLRLDQMLILFSRSTSVLCFVFHHAGEIDLKKQKRISITLLPR